jgi:hypothetical protein
MSDETTDKMFPPPEERHGAPVIPLPLTRSIREEFLAHRLVIESELKAWRVELGAGLARLTPPVTASGIASKAKAGALAGLRYGGVAVAAGELAAAVAQAAGRPEIEGPIRVLVSLFSGRP